MTAAGGILHEEFHSAAFTEQGGTIEMVQLWVNLPARHKMDQPGYQTLLNADIPVVELPHGAGRVRVIAGEFGGQQGPARTHTPMNVWDMRLAQGSPNRFSAVDGHTLALVVLHGTVMLNGSAVVREGQLVHFARTGTEVEIEANNDVTLLWLAGEPIEESIVGHGPFVMNTQAEIRQAIDDFHAGRFGEMPGLAKADGS